MTDRQERLWLGALLILFIAVNLATATRSPAVWMDEVMYVDPAANLLLGQGFTSSASRRQFVDEFWAGNFPLFPALSYLWLSLFGLSIAAFRAFSYPIFALALLTVWAVMRRGGLIRRPEMRLAVVVALMCGYGMSFMYRSGRPDPLGFLLIAAAGLAYVESDRWWGRWGLFAAGLLSSLAQLPPVIYAALVAALATPFFGFRHWPGSLRFGFGALSGYALLFAIYVVEDVLDDFWGEVFFHSFAARMEGVGQFVDPNWSIWTMLDAYRIDHSMTVMLGLSGLLGLFALWRRRAGAALPPVRMMAFLVATALAVPPVLSAIGVFQVFYNWMSYVPATLAIAWWLENDASLEGWRLIRIGAITTALVAMVAGLPARIGLTVKEWDKRDYGPVQAMVTRTVQPTDWVYADFTAYYAAKARAERVFLPTYHMGPQHLTVGERNRISVLIVPPENFEEMAALLGGTWQPAGPGVNTAISERAGIAFGSPLYDLQVYRREPPRLVNVWP
jgi:hypothetical protein